MPQAIVPNSGWAYTDANNTAIKLTTGNFVANDIYEFSYVAKDPTVNGLGLAAIRDFNSFLRYASHDDLNTRIRSPATSSASTLIRCEPARTLNDFTHLGFNEDEKHRKVFDGLMQWVGAGDGLNMNYRWSQTKRTERARQEETLYLRSQTCRVTIRFRERPTGATRRANSLIPVRWRSSFTLPTSTG